MTPEQAQKYNIPVIQGGRGEWQFNDQLYVNGILYVVRYVDKSCVSCISRNDYGRVFDLYDSALIWLPPAINDEQPERGLWGMVDWTRFIGETQGNGTLTILDEDTDVTWNSDPTNALLQAIAEQNN